MKGSGLSVAAAPNGYTAESAPCAVPEVIEHDDVVRCNSQQLGISVLPVCARTSMSSQAPSGWAKIHVKPHVGRFTYTCSVSVGITTMAVVYVGAVPWGIPIMNIPALSVVSYVFLAGWIWRFGPAAAAAPTYLAASSVLTLASSFFVTVVFIGPTSYSPFGDRLSFLIGASLCIFATLLSGLFGGIAADQPPQPYTTI